MEYRTQFCRLWFILASSKFAKTLVAITGILTTVYIAFVRGKKHEKCKYKCGKYKFLSFKAHRWYRPYTIGDTGVYSKNYCRRKRNGRSLSLPSSYPYGKIIRVVFFSTYLNFPTVFVAVSGASVIYRIGDNGITCVVQYSTCINKTQVFYTFIWYSNTLSIGTTDRISRTALPTKLNKRVFIRL